MIVLGVESATAEVGCALAGPEGVLASFACARGRRHAEVLTPAIEFTCRQAGVALSEVGAIAVDLGPGLFTGLRVGVAAARAFALALGVPAVGCSSLDLLASGVRFAPQRIVAVVDARRGEVFSASYRGAPGGVEAITEPAVGTPGALAAELAAAGEDCLLVGDGAARHAAAFAAVPGPGVVGAYPSAGVLATLARADALAGRAGPPGALRPLYLRQADVAIRWEERAPRRALPEPAEVG